MKHQHETQRFTKHNVNFSFGCIRPSVFMADYVILSRQHNQQAFANIQLAAQHRFQQWSQQRNECH
jgi:hypothetical protein